MCLQLRLLCQEPLEAYWRGPFCTWMEFLGIQAGDGE